MIKTRLTIDKTNSGYVLNVDGGSIECQTESEVMSRVGAEMGMPFNKAQRQLFERMETAEKVADSIGREATELRKELNDEREKNLQMRQAIVRWFVRAFKEGDDAEVH